MTTIIKTSIITSPPDTPSDLRTVISDLSAIGSINYPYLGLLFYVISEKLVYTVTSVSGGRITGYTKFHASGNIGKIVYRGTTYIPSDSGILEIPALELVTEMQNQKSWSYKVEDSYDTFQDALTVYLSQVTPADGSVWRWQDKRGYWHEIQGNEVTAGNFDWQEIGSFSEVSYSECKAIPGFLNSQGHSSDSKDFCISPYIKVPKYTQISYTLTVYSESLGIVGYDEDYQNPTPLIQAGEDGEVKSGVIQTDLTYIRYSWKNEDTRQLSLITQESFLRDQELLAESKEKIKEIQGETSYKEVATWNRPGLNPNCSFQSVGDLRIINSKGFYLVDTTSGKSVNVVGELQKNNWLKFTTGTWAPVCQISATDYSASSVALYEKSGTLAYSAGQYDPEDYWKKYGNGGLQNPTPLYNAAGEAVYCRRPWEAVDKGYDIVCGWPKDIWVIGGDTDSSGREVFGFFEKETYYNGILARRIESSGRCPGLPTEIGGKLRSIYSKDGTGTAGYAYNRYGPSSKVYPTYAPFKRSGYAYPAYNVNQITTMQKARAKNTDKTSPLPCSEGMACQKFAHIYSLFVKYGTYYLHDPNLWGGGISANEGRCTDATWGTKTGFRYRTDQTSTSYAYSRTDEQSGAIGTQGSGGGIYFYTTPTALSTDRRPTVVMNGEAPKERCLESQIVLSFAVQNQISEGTHFWYDGEEYWYTNINGQPGLLENEYLNAKLFKAIPEEEVFGFTDRDSPETSETSLFYSAIIQMPVTDGEVLWGDVFDYGYGGLEVVVNVETSTSSGNVFTNPYDEYMCWQQKDLDYCAKANTDGKFDLEYKYEYMSSGIRKENYWYRETLKPWSLSSIKTGAGLSTGACSYSINFDYSGWFNNVGQHYRAGLRGRGFATWGPCSARNWLGYFSVSCSSRIFAPSLQVFLGDSNNEIE